MSMDDVDDLHYAEDSLAAAIDRHRQAASDLTQIAWDFGQRDEDLHAALIELRDRVLAAVMADADYCRPTCGLEDRGECGDEFCGCPCHEKEPTEATSAV
jgi:hypothetical protein